MNLTSHFTLEELILSQTATRLGIDNTPDANALDNLHSLAAGLELVRAALGNRAISVSSGFRCIKLNGAIGSNNTSAHVLGWAADFVCPGFGTPLEVAKALAATTIKFDQVIYEGAWVHISVDPRNRRELLTAHFKGGKTTYTKGIA